MGFNFPVPQRDDIQQPLWLGPIIGVIIFPGKNLDTDVLLKVAQLHRLKGQFIPSLHRWIELVVEEGVTVSVIGTGPGEKNAHFQKQRIASLQVLEISGGDQESPREGP